MAQSVAARPHQNNRAQRPPQSAPFGTPRQNNSYNGQKADFAVHGQKAQLHARASSRGQSRTGWQQQGPDYPPDSIPAYYPSANIFGAANQDQLLAAYVAMMQSAANSPVAHPQQVVGSNNGGNSSMAYYHTAVIDWNGLLSRQGSSIPASNRLADLMGLLPQPKFSVERPEGSAPDTPESLRMATVVKNQQQQYISTPHSAAAVFVPSYAYQQHFSSYWTAAAAAAQPGSPHVAHPMLPTQGSGNSSYLGIAPQQGQGLSSVDSGNLHGSSSDGSTVYYSCNSGEGTQSPTHAASPTAAPPSAAAMGYVPAASFAFAPWQQQLQQLWPVWVPAPGSPVCGSPHDTQGTWSPVYDQQYIMYMQHMQYMQQQQQQQNYASCVDPHMQYIGHAPAGAYGWQQQQQQPGLHRTGSDPSAVNHWQQQQRARRHWQQPGRSSPLQRGNSCPGGNSSIGGSGNQHNSRNGGGGGGGGGANQQRRRRPSRLAAMTHGSIIKPDRPMSAIAEGEGTLVANVPRNAAPTPPGTAAAAAAESAAAGAGAGPGTSPVAQQTTAPSSAQAVMDTGTGNKDSTKGQLHCKAGSSNDGSSSCSRPDFFLSHSGSGAAGPPAKTSDTAGSTAAAEFVTVTNMTAAKPTQRRDKRSSARSNNGQVSAAAVYNRDYQPRSIGDSAAASPDVGNSRKRQVWQRHAGSYWQHQQQQPTGYPLQQQQQQHSQAVNWEHQPHPQQGHYYQQQQHPYPAAPPFHLPYLVSNSDSPSYKHRPTAAAATGGHYSPMHYSGHGASPRANAHPCFSSNARRNNCNRGSSSGGSLKLPQLSTPYRSGSADSRMFHNAFCQPDSLAKHAVVQRSISIDSPGSLSGSARWCPSKLGQRHNMQGSNPGCFRQPSDVAASSYERQGGTPLARGRSTAAAAAGARANQRGSWGGGFRRSNHQQYWQQQQQQHGNEIIHDPYRRYDGHTGSINRRSGFIAVNRGRTDSHGGVGGGGGCHSQDGSPTAQYSRGSSNGGASPQRMRVYSKAGRIAGSRQEGETQSTQAGNATLYRTASEGTASGWSVGVQPQQVMLPPIRTGREGRTESVRQRCAAGARQAGGILGQVGQGAFRNAAVVSGSSVRNSDGGGARSDAAAAAVGGSGGAGSGQPRSARGGVLKPTGQRKWK